MTTPYFASEAESEEMDIIRQRLSKRGAETTLEGASEAWTIITNHRHHNDLEAMRIFDRCYSRKHKLKTIVAAITELRANGRHELVPLITPEGVIAYQLVWGSISRYEIKNLTVISEEVRPKLRIMALSRPDHGEAISNLIVDRGITDPDEIASLLEYMTESPSSIVEGVL